MKQGRFVMVAGLGGALAGILVFLLTRPVAESLPLRLAAGGAAAVVVPLLAVLFFYRRLVK